MQHIYTQFYQIRWSWMSLLRIFRPKQSPFNNQPKKRLSVWSTAYKLSQSQPNTVQAWVKLTPFWLISSPTVRPSFRNSRTSIFTRLTYLDPNESNQIRSIGHCHLTIRSNTFSSTNIIRFNMFAKLIVLILLSFNEGKNLK